MHVAQTAKPRAAEVDKHKEKVSQHLGNWAWVPSTRRTSKETGAWMLASVLWQFLPAPKADLYPGNRGFSSNKFSALSIC